LNDIELNSRLKLIQDDLKESYLEYKRDISPGGSAASLQVAALIMALSHTLML